MVGIDWGVTVTYAICGGVRCNGTLLLVWVTVTV